MKLYIKTSKELTSNDLHELFRKIDWDDVDYANRLIDRTIKKHIPVDFIFDQAKYINMLDEDVKSDLMYLLENPEALHEKRMKNRKKSKKKTNGSSSVVLDVKYEDYPDGNVKTATFSGSDKLEALKNLVSSLGLYLDVDIIEDNNLSADDVIDEIESSNGDGCDYIISLKDRNTGEVLMDCPYEDELEV